MTSNNVQEANRLKQILKLVLENSNQSLFKNDHINLMITEHKVQKQQMNVYSEFLGLNTLFLAQTPNQIYQYFQFFEETLLNNNQSSGNTYEISKRQHLFRLISLIYIIHPVLNKQIEQLFVKSCFFSGFKFENKFNLQNLNILCLNPTFNSEILNLNKRSLQLKENSYEKALWLNIVNSLTHSQFYNQWRQRSQQINQQNVCKVRDFINIISQLKEKIHQVVYEEFFESLNKTNVIKIDGIEQKQYLPEHFSSLDVFMSFNDFISIDYLPQNFANLQSEQFIEIWIDRTVEVNSLMGNFICKQKLGQFQYVKGPLMHAIQKGIILVLNNFQQISHQLLVTMRTLSTRHEINHNQKSIYAKSGFKIIGICSMQARKKSKSLNNSISIIPHFYQKPKNIEDFIPYQFIKNQINVQFIQQSVARLQNLGLNSQVKLWKRMKRLRTKVVNFDLADKDQMQIMDKLWNGYVTESFKQDVEVQIQQLTNNIDFTRNIDFHREYKSLKIGRCELSLKSIPSQNIVPTQYSLRILERLAVCQDEEINESPLLISQTGCGKTTLVQYLAQIASKKLYVYNMSSGTDVTDLVGGFKPIDCRVMLKQLFYSFTQKFMNEVPGAEKNKAYVNSLISYYESDRLQLLLKSLIQSIPKIKLQLKEPTVQCTQIWDQMLRKFTNILSNLDKIDSNLVFSFMEGNLVTALKNGDWILIDEINLATNDVLQKIVPLVEGKSILLYEKGDLTYIFRNSGFKVIACMNPATDSGKKPLPANLQDKFTSINLSEPNRNDIQMMVNTLCPQLNSSQIADIYFEIKKLKTVSLRNLSRSLAYINKNRETYGWQRATYDGLVLGYGQKAMLQKFKNQIPPKQKFGYKMIHGFLVEQGPLKDQKVQIFHLTKTFTQHLKDFLRAIAGTDLPVLLQGPTSAGKTSMIKYVAELAGHRCIRINNHEHTQIEQYLGNYFPDKQGKLVFREGPLVTAVRQGHWLILDELNLAKTQILECLNRLLDDNRQLFIPEQQKHIKPHKSFRIFATQNPSSYSGRKKLSRAFRNRFISLMFTDITVVDTMAILQARRPLVEDSKQLSNYIKKVLQSLINYRQRQKVFSKDGLITMRDLLKWTGRKFISKDMFIIEGYGIFAQRLRTLQQKQHVLEVLSAGSKITEQSVFAYYENVVAQDLSQDKIKDSKIYVQMNKSFKRMAALTCLGVDNNQAILLVGQTGCGKTTLAQLLSYVLKRPFYSINCHKHTQASDLLGSLRPSSDPNSISRFQFVNGVVIDAMINGGILLIDEINTAEDSVLQRLNEVLQSNTIGVQRGQGWESIKAKQGFCIIATMNPSGDYGKKQLSPALRNRFTEIWVQPITHPALIVDAKSDIILMIQTKLQKAYSKEINSEIAELIYEFIRHYNCQIAEKYNLTRKRLTMRDIGWMCKFITESKDNFQNDWRRCYFWALNILAIEGLKFMMNDEHETFLLKDMKVQLTRFIENQSQISLDTKVNAQLEVIKILKDMDFPLMIKTDLPLELIGLKPDSRIFFSAHTDLSDLLGQFQPVQSSFIWKDQQLLKNIRSGGRTALMDLNLAQQQVIQGINSLFDYRGSIFVVQLNQTVYKDKNFKPMVVLKYTSGSERKGLPNSFLNRFVKICVDNVSIQTKINYIRSKYPQVKEKILGLLPIILQKEPFYPIQKLELLCQVCSYSPIQLQTCLEYLELHQIVKVDKFYLMNDKDGFNINQISSEYEERLLRCFPLIQKKFNLQTSLDIHNVKKINIIYSLSRFSACLIGNCRKRDQTVQILATVLDKKIIKIILSTMTDMNDLLGSYEQITEQTQNHMAEQRTLQNAFNSTHPQNHEGKKTKFVYQQSSIVKALKDQSSLLYIQVPNQILLQRVEKGLIDVYMQNKQIILGIDTMRETKVGTTKFIPIRLVQNVQKLVQNSQRLIKKIKQTRNYFIQNLSNLNHLNQELKRKQLQNYIQEQIRNQSSRQKILAYKKMIVQNKNYDINSLESHTSLVEKQKKCRQKRIKQLPFTFIQSLSLVGLEDLYTEIKKSIIENQPHDFNSFKQRMLIKSFLGINIEEINKRTVVTGVSQQKVLQTIQKFQVLFVCNLNNFQATSLRILSVIFSPRLSADESKQMLGKFSDQIQRLYEQIFRDKIKQIVINFTDEQTKIIPIVLNVQTTKYQMRLNSVSVRLISEVTPKPSLILEQGIEKKVVQILEVLRVNEPQISTWVNHMRLRDLKPYEIFEQKIKIKNSIIPSLQALQQICIQFLKSCFSEQIQKEFLQLNTDNTSLAIVEKLLNTFKPSQSLAENVSLHIKSQIQFETIKQVILQDQTYIECFKQICEIKYLGLQPSKYLILTKSIETYQQRLSIIAKSIVYRGHDNVKSLLEFYQYLMNAHQKMENQKFNSQTVKVFLLESYQTFYDTFSDILLPYYLPLLVLYKQNSQINHDNSLSLQIFQKQFEEKPVFALLQSIINNQNEQMDHAKDFIKYQRKFNHSVIIDQYTQEGVKKNKDNLQIQFNQLFGKTQTQQSGNLSEIDLLFYLLNKETQSYYNILCNKLNENTKNFEQLITSLALTTTNKKVINIYEQRNTDSIKLLIQPIPKMLNQVHVLLEKYKIDTLKSLAALLGKIYDHKAYKDQIYKILVDCQFIIEKSFQLNSILPMAQRVPTDEIIVECLKLRRLQLKNWKSMLYYKQLRTQKSDTINLIEFYKVMKMVQNSKEAFAVSENFLRESTVCCLPSRMNFLDLIGRSFFKDQQIQTSIYRVIGFYEYLMPHVNQFFMNSYNGKVAEMKQYEKLAGWSSNQYLIFKATCQKFQRKIHHILRKFDDQLSISLASLILQIKTKQIASSVDEFNTRSKKEFQRVPEVKEADNQGNQQKNNDIRGQKQKSEKVKALQQEPVQQQKNQYEELIDQLFDCLNQLSQGYQNSQSKLRLIRLSLQEIQQFVKTKKNQSIQAISATENKYLIKEMFNNQDQYKKACKHYYGLWDKLCQRQQTAWNRQILDRIWNVAENIWKISNTFIPKSQPPAPESQLVEDLKVLFKPYLLGQVNKESVSNKYLQNPIFKRQIQNVKRFILQNAQTVEFQYKKVDIEALSMMKLGYLIASIAINLQKNGLCVKDQQQNDGSESGTQEVADGMGIGQGEIQQGAQNVGDQIEFEQQVQGHKDQEKAEQDNKDNKQQDNDIEMEGEFQGEMHDKQKKQDDDQEGQQAQQISNQQMGQVDNDKREQDLKNQQGQAQGKEDADIDIQGQQQGEQQLVDNQRQQNKQQRKGQQKRQDGQQQEEQQERSDWQDNNDQGQKINKQKQDVQQHQKDSNDMADQKQPQQISGQENSGESQEVQQESKMDQENQGQSNSAEENSEGSQEGQNQEIQIENSEQPMEQQGQENKQQQEKQKKQAKNRKQYQKTYGRKDNKFQNNNLVNEQPINQQQNLGQGQQNQQGKGEGQKGAGKSVHSLRQEFMQEIMKKQNQSKGNEQFHKNLDVRIQEEDDQEINQKDQINPDEQQYALTEEDKKLSTNLGMMDLQDKKKEEQKKEAEKEKQRNLAQKEENKQQKNKDKNTLNQKKKPSQKESTNEQMTKNNEVKQQNIKNQDQLKREQMQLQQSKRDPTKPDKNKAKVVNLIDQHEQQLIKAAILSLSNNKNNNFSLSLGQRSHLLAQSFLLSKILQEQLKSVLQPLDQAEYKGDYKTGKKLNLKKIIPFIASNYRKDRIWLRRTEPSERNYFIMLALDDTKSMHYGDVGQQALKGLLSIGMALQQLNIKTCITAIKDTMQISKNFNDLLNCQKVLEDFSFQYQSSNSHDLSMSSFMASSLNEFEKVQATDSNGQSRQLCIIISDGKMNKQMVKPFLKQASKKGITYVFIIIDSAKNSILDIKTVQYVNGKIQIKSYMNDFPYDFFLVINNAKQLGDILGATLMQFIQQK